MKTGSGSDPASYWMDMGSFCEMKWLGHEDDRSPPCSADDKNDCSCTSTTHMCLHSMDGANATFIFILSCTVRPTYNANKNNSNWLKNFPANWRYIHILVHTMLNYNFGNGKTQLKAVSNPVSNTDVSYTGLHSYLIPCYCSDVSLFLAWGLVTFSFCINTTKHRYRNGYTASCIFKIRSKRINI
jgi:hypothetical protein